MNGKNGLLRSGTIFTAQTECNHDCFNCVYDDCVYDGVTEEEIISQDKYDTVISSENELVEPEVLRMRESVRKYKRTEKGKETNRRYERTEKAKERRLRYYRTEKGIRNILKQRERQRERREAERKRRIEEIERANKNCGYNEELFKQLNIFDLST